MAIVMRIDGRSVGDKVRRCEPMGGELGDPRAASMSRPLDAAPGNPSDSMKCV